MIYVFLANGFEEVEALAPLDLLRRAGKQVTTVGIGGEEIQGAHGVTVRADIPDAMFRDSAPEAILLPGGMPGSLNLLKCHRLRDMLTAHNGREGLVAAICAAPMVLGDLGILAGRKATCYPGFEDRLIDATHVAKLVVEDGHIITGRGPAAAVDFGCAIASRFVGAQAVTEVRKGMLFE